MDHIGIDVHMRESQIYILAQGGKVIEQQIRTEPERFAAVLRARPPPSTGRLAGGPWLSGGVKASIGTMRRE